MKKCETCGLPVPLGKFDPMVISCSKFHVRCIRCNWPVAWNFMDEDSVCDLCKGKREKKEKEEL